MYSGNPAMGRYSWFSSKPTDQNRAGYRSRTSTQLTDKIVVELTLSLLQHDFLGKQNSGEHPRLAKIVTESCITNQAQTWPYWKPSSGTTREKVIVPPTPRLAFVSTASARNRSPRAKTGLIYARRCGESLTTTTKPQEDGVLTGATGRPEYNPLMLVLVLVECFRIYQKKQSHSRCRPIHTRQPTQTRSLCDTAPKQTQANKPTQKMTAV
jgi:hypothetical protein